jgi:hypothetical protein
MTEEGPLTPEMLLDQLRAANGMVIEIDRGPLAQQYTAMLPRARKISPLMFSTLERHLTQVATLKSKNGAVTKTYKLRVAQDTEQ